MSYAPPSLSNLPLLYQGKTRDTYWLPATVDGYPTTPELLLFDCTNRLSTHNIVHTSHIPFKGQVLTALTIYWFIDVLKLAGFRHHIVAYGADIYDYLPGKRRDYPADLHLHAIVVRKLNIIQVEFIFRMYLAGSLFTDYYSQGKPDPYGLNLQDGLVRMSPFPEPIFTPTDKSESDDPRNADEVRKKYPQAHDLVRSAFLLTRGHLLDRNITQIDCKGEVGVDEFGNCYLSDEFATPDCSRLARTADIKEGEDPPWLDKQLARDEAERHWAAGEPKGPLVLSPLVISRLTDKYLEVFQLITGSSLARFQEDRLKEGRPSN